MEKIAEKLIAGVIQMNANGSLRDDPHGARTEEKAAEQWCNSHFNLLC